MEDTTSVHFQTLMVSGLSSTAALSATAQWLAQQPGIISAVANNTTISFLTSAGLKGIIILVVSGTDDTFDIPGTASPTSSIASHNLSLSAMSAITMLPSVCLTPSSSDVSSISANNLLLLAPFGSFTHFEEPCGILLENANAQCPCHVTKYYGSDVSFSLLQTLDWSQFGTVVIDSHGGVDPDTQQVIMVTGDSVPTPQPVSDILDQLDHIKYDVAINLLVGVPIPQNFFEYHYYGFGPELIASFTSTLPHSVVFLAGCSTIPQTNNAPNYTLADAFKDKGATAVIGYTVDYDNDHEAGADLFHGLFAGENVALAVQNTNNFETTLNLLAYWPSDGGAATISPTTGAYTITDLGTLPGLSSCSVVKINNAGQAAGTCVPSSSGTTSAFLWSNGTMTAIPGMNAAVGLNDAGVVVGYGAPTVIGGVSYPTVVVYPADPTKTADFVQPVGINKQGIIAITQSTCCNGGASSYIYSQNILSNGYLVPQIINPDGFSNGWAMGINDSNTVVGYLPFVDGGASNAIIVAYSVGSFNPVCLGTFNGPGCSDIPDFSVATAINNVGQIVGSSYGGTCPSTCAFLYSGGVMTNLAMTNLGPIGQQSIASGLNNLAQVVGGGGANLAWIYQHGTIQDLNTLVLSNSGWTLQNAVSINDSGQIVGTGSFNGQIRSFLLKPVKCGI